MKIIVFGATGKIGSLLVPELIEAGHGVVAYVRSAEKGASLKRCGADLHVADLEAPIDLGALAGVDACIFTAGSGSATGKDKTLTIDLWGAIKTVRACEQAGVRRYIMVSALKASDPDRGAEGIRPYLVAKHAADALLMASSLDYTILRPGRLTDEPGSGQVAAGPSLENYDGAISRANVARALQVCLEMPGTIGKTYELLDGPTSITAAFGSS
ncbi:MAG: NAD(P)H-binding protein [Verrucomicrobia bacterium]|jgi:uncharacterized protein YbjT (DUF2867 family)|nr:NAD(P)H-binding protein [Verrucomicrobiota bacterium]